MTRYEFAFCCVNAPDVKALSEMIDAERQITRRTFRKHAQGVDEWAKDRGYALHPSQGLTLAADWHVTYHRSTYKGQRCYFACWSAIEWVWLPLA